MASLGEGQTKTKKHIEELACACSIGPFPNGNSAQYSQRSHMKQGTALHLVLERPCKVSMLQPAKKQLLGENFCKHLQKALAHCFILFYSSPVLTYIKKGLCHLLSPELKMEPSAHRAVLYVCGQRKNSRNSRHEFVPSQRQMLSGGLSCVCQGTCRFSSCSE